MVLFLSALYFFLDMCLSPHVVHKGIQEIKCGETHRDNKTEFDRKNHGIQKATE